MGNLHPVTIAIIVINALISMKGFNDSSLLFNMLSLYFFSNAVIYNLGVVNFVIIYAAGLLVGNLLSFYFHKNEYHYSAVGASGAVSGVIYAGILLNPGMTINFFIPGWAFGIGYLLYSIYGMRAKNDNIGHDAHFGGAMGGFVATPTCITYCCTICND